MIWMNNHMYWVSSHSVLLRYRILRSLYCSGKKIGIMQHNNGSTLQFLGLLTSVLALILKSGNAPILSFVLHQSQPFLSLKQCRSKRPTNFEQLDYFATAKPLKEILLRAIFLRLLDSLASWYPFRAEFRCRRWMPTRPTSSQGWHQVDVGSPARRRRSLELALRGPIRHQDWALGKVLTEYQRFAEEI